MPNCRDCVHFRESGLDFADPQCLLSILPVDRKPTWNEHKARVKACERAILLKHLPNISGEVLEVGAGVSRWNRKLIKKQATWYGVDPAWVTNESKNSFQAKVSSLPFENDKFDWVICFSSIEHWNEYGDDFESGMNEIYRCLKPDGRLLVTAPYRNHGHDIFYLKNELESQRIFFHNPWVDVYFEDWADDPSPLMGLQEWKIEKHRIPSMLDSNKSDNLLFTSTLEVLARK